MCTHRQVVLTEDDTLIIDDKHFGSLGLVLAFDDNLVRIGCKLIGTLLIESDAFDHVLEAYDTGGFNDGGGVVGIPFADEVSLLDGCAVLEVQR